MPLLGIPNQAREQKSTVLTFSLLSMTRRDLETSEWENGMQWQKGSTGNWPEVDTTSATIVMIRNVEGSRSKIRDQNSRIEDNQHESTHPPSVSNEFALKGTDEKFAYSRRSYSCFLRGLIIQQSTDNMEKIVIQSVKNGSN